MSRAFDSPPPAAPPLAAPGSSTGGSSAPATPPPLGGFALPAPIVVTPDRLPTTTTATGRTGSPSATHPRALTSSSSLLAWARPCVLVAGAWVALLVVGSLLLSSTSPGASLSPSAAVAAAGSRRLLSDAAVSAGDGYASAGGDHRRFAVETYDAALARVDERGAGVEFGYAGALASLQGNDFPDVDDSSKGALVLLREVLRHAAPLLRTAGRDSGMWVTSGGSLRKRMVAAAARGGRQCLRRDVAIVGCAVASLEARYLQEWAVWHTLVAGFSHLVVYHNHAPPPPSTAAAGGRRAGTGGDGDEPGSGVGADNTADVLAPFVEAGLVTVLPWVAGTHYDASKADAATSAASHCVRRMRAVSCRYEHGSPFDDDLPPCSAKELSAAASGGGSGRSVWAVPLGVDEFFAARDPDTCATDALRPYRNEAGLALFKRSFSHSGHLLAPRGALVTETFTRRVPGLPSNGAVRSVLNTRFATDIKRGSGGALGEFLGGKLAVAEGGGGSGRARVPVSVPLVPNAPPEAAQSVFIAHFPARGVEDAALAWVRGRPGAVGSFHARVGDPGALTGAYAEGRSPDAITDEALLPGAALVRDVLRPAVHAPLLGQQQHAGGGAGYQGYGDAYA